MLRPRKPDIDTQAAGVPRHWFAGSPVASHIANGVNLLFPAGERFFVRSVNKFLPRITDETLRAEVRAFFGQEGRHAQAHEGDMARLRAQGYEIDAFLERYQRWMYGVLEKLTSDELNLAGTAAAEHFTALMAERALSTPLLDLAHPEMARLLRWHAAEEIEHKHVAFDVLRQVNPSYALRMGGLALSFVMLTSWWIAATAMLLRQDGYTLAKFRAEMKELEAGAQARGVRQEPLGRLFLRGIRDYMRRDFHPRDQDNYALAQAWLEQAGMEPAGTEPPSAKASAPEVAA